MLAVVLLIDCPVMKTEAAYRMPSASNARS